MNEMDIGTVIKDFRSIKLSKNQRQFINTCKSRLESNGELPLDIKVRLRKMVGHFRVQFEELHASRARAKRTNWARSCGLTLEEAAALVQDRRATVAAQREDTGL